MTQMGQGPPGVTGGAGRLLSFDGAASASSLRRGLTVHPRCGGRGRDQGGNYAHLDPNAGGVYQISVKQGPAYRPETPAETKEGLGHSRPAAA